MKDKQHVRQRTSSPREDESFRVFAESIPNLAWTADPDGSIYWYNRRWYEYTGTTSEQMHGWGWQTVHDPAMLPKVMANWQASIASGEPFEMSFPLRDRNGIFNTFLTRVHPLKDEDGRVLRWFGTNTDISEQVRAAAALRASEARFRTATEAISAILWTNDATGRMLGDQPAWSAFTGQGYAEYQGYGWSAAVHREDAQPTIDAWQRCVRERCLFSFEHRLRRHDGVFRLCSIRAMPILDEYGEVREWVGVHTDITEERETQRTLHQAVTELRQQQELLEAAQQIVQVGFWRYEPAGRTLFLSSGSRHLLGLPREGDITTAQALACIHPEDRAGIEQAFLAAVGSGRFHVDFRPKPSPGAEARWVRGAAHMATAPSGERYLVGMNLDVTQEKRASETLMRTEKLAVAGRLAASIAHEINNPLEAITNILYLMLQGPLDPEQRDLALMLRSELERVSHIATHTLRFHRQSTRASVVDIGDLIESVLALHEGRLRNADVQVMRRLRASRTLQGYDGELRQVLANLVANAIDAMQPAQAPRTLTLRSRDACHPRTAEPGILVTVADTGTGMPPETRQRIYEAFFTTKPDTGTGLGLWVSFEIVGKHHGSLRVRSSTRPGASGTVFQVFLPLAGTPSAAV